MMATTSLKGWLDTALGFIYPPVCQLCGHEHATANEGFLCVPCRQKVRFIEPPFCERCGLPYEGDINTTFQCANCLDMELHFRSARSAVHARDAVLEVIHRYKYNRQLWFEPFLSELLIAQARPVLAQENWDMIVPVPLHSAKRRERGFNQAERLARQLSYATGIPVNTRALKRTIPTETQTHLDRAHRAANVKRSFAPRKPLSKGARIVLVDDVFTTGATTNACAKILRSAGAGEVCVWTVARGL